jgi:hypothetical protein
MNVQNQTPLANDAIPAPKGCVQPGQEWLAALRCGRFDYHSIALASDALAISEAGLGVTVSGRVLIDATIDGGRHPWRVQFTLGCAMRGAVWKIVWARYRSASA